MTYLFNKIFKWLISSNHYEIEDIDYEDRDAEIIITLDGKKYYLSLEWDGGNMDIEFNYNDDTTLDTTNFHHHYKLLITIHDIVHKVAKKITLVTGMKFKTVSFLSSNTRNGVRDEKSKVIRDKLFTRYVIKKFPNAIVEKRGQDIIINLYGKK